MDQGVSDKYADDVIRDSSLEKVFRSWADSTSARSWQRVAVQMNWIVRSIALDVDTCVQLHATRARTVERRTW